MSVDSLQQQITSAVGRFNALQRRVEDYSPEPPKVLRQALHELSTTIESLRVAQDQLNESRQLLEVAREDLQREPEKYWDFFDSAPDPYVVTGPQSEIIEANKTAAELLNISQRFQAGKMLGGFVCDERARFMAQTARLAQTGGSADSMMCLPPRERAPIEVAARAVAIRQGPDVTLRWMFRRVSSRHAAQ